jgi:GNAT superfamily N-acetyltransferase
VPAEARTTTRTDGAVARRRAIAWRRAQHAGLCDVDEPWEYGTAVRCTPLPTFWNYNSLRVEGSDTGVTADRLVHAADVLQGDLQHRQVEIEDEAAGERLRPRFDALGWSTERLAWMLLDGPAPAGPDFEEVPFVDTGKLRVEWTLTAPWATDEATAERFTDHEDAVAALRETRALQARDAAGAPIGFASFAARDDGAEVEQVYVSPAHRGGGTGGAMVAAAARTAGGAFTFIVADDAGDSKRLYARLGFEPVWLQHVFTRRPG